MLRQLFHMSRTPAGCAHDAVGLCAQPHPESPDGWLALDGTQDPAARHPAHQRAAQGVCVGGEAPAAAALALLQSLPGEFQDLVAGSRQVRRSAGSVAGELGLVYLGSVHLS